MNKLFQTTEDRISLKNDESISFVKAFAQNGADFKADSRIKLSITVLNINGTVLKKSEKRFNDFLKTSHTSTAVVDMDNYTLTNQGEQFKTVIMVTDLRGEEQVLCEYLFFQNMIVPLPQNKNPFQVH